MRAIEEIKADIKKNHSRECRDDQPELWDEIVKKSDELWLEYFKTLTDGISTERLEAICTAEQEGRLVVLPCKVLYEPTWDAGEKCDLKCPPGECDACDKAEQFIYERKCTQQNMKQIGKTVFLTREEAEKALRGGGEDNGSDGRMP